MFTLKSQRAKLNSAHVSPEMHGEEPVPAQYLGIEVDMQNTILDQFNPELLNVLYKPADQAEIDGSLPSLRFPLMQDEIKWKYEGAGYKAKIDYGIDDTTAIVLTDVKVDRIVFGLKEGGTVRLKMRLAAKTDEATSGRLDHMQQTEITLTLTPPSKKDLERMAKEAAKGKQEEIDA